MEYITEPERRIPVIRDVDVLVVGGGPAGLMAAQAAAGGNHRVMLVESRSYLGGNLTIGLPVLAFLGPRGDQVIYGGAQRFIDRLRARGAASGHKPCKLHMSLTIIDPEEAKNVAFELMEEAGVEVRLYTFVSDAIVEDGVVKGVVVESKAGRQAILARRVIDCTGDGDVAFRAGVPCSKGDAIVLHPETYDMDRMPAEQFREGNFITVGLRGRIEEARRSGLDVPVSRTILISGLKPDEIWVNMTRVNGTDSTDPESYTRCEVVARRQMRVVTEYLRRFVPGFAQAEVDKVAPFTGIRESRVIRGKYILTAEDILGGKHFDDKVCLAGYPVDIHHSQGGDCSMYFCDDAYEIPYRVLVPANVGGLLVAGRCASMNHEAMAATRVMSTCMALGEAAGTAARLSLETCVDVGSVDIPLLQQTLVSQGVRLV